MESLDARELNRVRPRARPGLVGVSVLCLLLTAAPLLAQSSGVGTIEGFVTTQGGTIRLGGAQIVVRNAGESGNRDDSV